MNDKQVCATSLRKPREYSRECDSVPRWPGSHRTLAEMRSDRWVVNDDAENRRWGFKVSCDPARDDVSSFARVLRSLAIINSDHDTAHSNVVYLPPHAAVVSFETAKSDFRHVRRVRKNYERPFRWSTWRLNDVQLFSRHLAKEIYRAAIIESRVSRYSRYAFVLLCSSLKVRILEISGSTDQSGAHYGGEGCQG